MLTIAANQHRAAWVMGLLRIVEAVFYKRYVDGNKHHALRGSLLG